MRGWSWRLISSDPGYISSGADACGNLVAERRERERERHRERERKKERERINI
tara:strand:- start:62 stop:220 length:159 start_codon:yes stop_codon:yes gene_type:complete